MRKKICFFIASGIFAFFCVLILAAFKSSDLTSYSVFNGQNFSLIKAAILIIPIVVLALLFAFFIKCVGRWLDSNRKQKKVTI